MIDYNLMRNFIYYVIASSIILYIFGFTMKSVYAKHLHPEEYYQKLDCYSRGGVVEYELQNKTRIDCMLTNEVIEHDFASKWYECVGQALYYSMKTNKRGVCTLIVENQKDNKYVERAVKTVKYYDLPLDIRVVE